jgi:hypothetical protein|tara:strand:+ start:2323 stop:2700 length:378 start_codon:yes stop_codon:yes gene_type:complete
MSERQIKLEEAFLFEGLEIGGKQVHPMSANRRTFLRKMGNSVCGGEPDGDPDDGEEFGAVLFACTKTPPELGSYLARREDWKNDSLSFTINLENHVIERFQVMIQSEVEAMQAAQVEPLGKDEAP